MHQSTKFQQNRAMHSGVTGDPTNFRAHFSGDPNEPLVFAVLHQICEVHRPTIDAWVYSEPREPVWWSQTSFSLLGEANCHSAKSLWSHFEARETDKKMEEERGGKNGRKPGMRSPCIFWDSDSDSIRHIV